MLLDLTNFYTLSAIAVWTEIIALFTGGYFAYQVFSRNRNEVCWFAISLGLILIGVSRFLDFLLVFQLVSNSIGISIDELTQLVLPFEITCVLLWGMMGFRDKLSQRVEVRVAPKAKARKRAGK